MSQRANWKALGYQLHSLLVYYFLLLAQSPLMDSLINSSQVSHRCALPLEEDHLLF